MKKLYRGIPANSSPVALSSSIMMAIISQFLAPPWDLTLIDA